MPRKVFEYFYLNRLRSGGLHNNYELFVYRVDAVVIMSAKRVNSREGLMRSIHVRKRTSLVHSDIAAAAIFPVSWFPTTNP